MQSNTNKESFKLLQLSDTSKSSELELPEVTVQRKRRIRRKTRTSASPHLRSYNSSHKDSVDDIQSSCNNVGLWIAVFMSCGWLLILSYMMAVVYTENRRLEVEISKLSTSNQNVPEALQNWHETSKLIEQNQTAIISTISAMQKGINDFEKDLNALKATISAKDKTSQNDTLLLLGTDIANFGAKIADLTGDVSSIKEKIEEMKAKENENQLLLSKIKDTFNSTSLAATSNATIDAIAANTNSTKYLTTQISSLSLDLSNVNNTMNQKMSGLDKDIKDYKLKLDSLTEDVANVTARVQSIQSSVDHSKIQESPLPPASTSNSSDVKHS